MFSMHFAWKREDSAVVRKASPPAHAVHPWLMDRSPGGSHAAYFGDAGDLFLRQQSVGLVQRHCEDAAVHLWEITHLYAARSSGWDSGYHWFVVPEETPD